VWFHLKLSYIL